jgi:transcriptional regulator with XRE-family HTH domain
MSNIETDSDPIAKTTPAKSSGRRYASVDTLMAGEGTPYEVQKQVKQLGSETAIVRRLVEIRHQAGLTQEEVANRLGKTQGAVSKMESGRDDDLTLEEVRRYAEVTGRRIGLYFGKPLSHVEAIQGFAFGIKEHLSALASLANMDEELKPNIQGFFGEAFFNILKILSECNKELPTPDVTIRVEVLDSPAPRRQLSAKRYVRRRKLELITPEEVPA